MNITLLCIKFFHCIQEFRTKYCWNHKLWSKCNCLIPPCNHKETRFLHLLNGINRITCRLAGNSKRESKLKWWLLWFSLTYSQITAHHCRCDCFKRGMFVLEYGGQVCLEGKAGGVYAKGEVEKQIEIEHEGMLVYEEITWAKEWRQGNEQRSDNGKSISVHTK